MARTHAIFVVVGAVVAAGCADTTVVPSLDTAVTSLLVSARGYGAVGAEGTTYDGVPHEPWVSDDGVSWPKVPQAATPRFDYGPGLVANGPADVIGISSSQGEGELVVWRLRRVPHCCHTDR